MFNKLATFTIKFKWAILVFWLVLTGIVFFVTPDLSSVTKGDQAAFLPQTSEPVKADILMREIFSDKGGRSSAVIAIKRESGLVAEDLEYLKELEKYFKNNEKQLNIVEMISPFANEETKKQLISKDNKAALLTVNLSVPTYTGITNDIIMKMKDDVGTGEGKVDPIKTNGAAPNVPKGLSISVTGDAALSQEENAIVDKSMDITVKITIGLVLIILILIYRSPVAPLTSLMTIGMSFLISRGIIAALADAGFKISNFTETFLVAVLFGAGTDYCLLLISRFREGLADGKTTREALMDAIPNTCAAIVSSGGTVMVGFLFMIFAVFGLFNSTGPSVAIGVAITILAVLTLMPALIAILGEKLFWPIHPAKAKAKGSRINKVWHKIAERVTNKPVRYIVISIAVLLPFFIAAGWTTQTFDQLKQLPDSTVSIQGFNILKQHFNQGEMMPVKIIIKSDKDLWDTKSLKVIDDIASDIARIDQDGVSVIEKVRTATRPLGEKITELSLPSQIDRLSQGMGDINGGIAPVAEGIGSMKDGIDKIAGGMVKGSNELEKLSKGTQSMATGVAASQQGIGKLSNGTGGIVDGLGLVNQSLSQIATGMGAANDGIDKMSAALSQAKALLEKMQKDSPEIANSAEYQGTYASVSGVATNLQTLKNGISTAQGAITQVNGAVGMSTTGLGDIKAGLDKVNGALSELKAGLEAMTSGQSQAGSGFTEISTKLSEISSGMQKSMEALDKIKTGMDDVKKASSAYIQSGEALEDVFFLPPMALEQSPELKSAMENYISKDGKGITLDVVLKAPPYTSQALDVINEIETTVKSSIRGTELANIEFHIGGATSVLNQVREITARDYKVVMLLVLLGIFVVLIFLLKSVIAPIYIILTIIFSYITTLGITNIVFVNILGYDGIHWTTPFFSFCILVALGVDYNIFLMARIKEEYVPGDVKGSIARALSSTGGIITSCGIIMAGTFGAMMVSPSKPLIQLGFAAVVGLLLDTFIIRCLLVPAIATKLGELNWWPGRKMQVTSVQRVSRRKIKTKNLDRDM